MDGEKGQSQKCGIAPRLAVAGLAAFLASTYAMPPALAQFGDFDRRGGFFGSFFDPFSGPRYERRPRHEPRPRYRARPPARRAAQFVLDLSIFPLIGVLFGTAAEVALSSMVTRGQPNHVGHESDE